MIRHYHKNNIVLLTSSNPTVPDTYYDISAISSQDQKSWKEVDVSLHVRCIGSEHYSSVY